MSNPIAESSSKYIEDILTNARNRKNETQVVARVGDGVWCRFSDATERKKRKLEHGTIIRIEIDQHVTTYTVLKDNSIDCEVFCDRDFGHSICPDDKMDKRTICVNATVCSPEFEMTIDVPEKYDAEEYIDSVLEAVLSEDLKYNCEWEFVDGISG